MLSSNVHLALGLVGRVVGDDCTPCIHFMLMLSSHLGRGLFSLQVDGSHHIP
jgi:hypothetical protein